MVLASTTDASKQLIYPCTLTGVHIHSIPISREKHLSKATYATTTFNPLWSTSVLVCLWNWISANGAKCLLGPCSCCDCCSSALVFLCPALLFFPAFFLPRSFLVDLNRILSPVAYLLPLCFLSILDVWFSWTFMPLVPWFVLPYMMCVFTFHLSICFLILHFCVVFYLFLVWVVPFLLSFVFAFGRCLFIIFLFPSFCLLFCSFPYQPLFSFSVPFFFLPTSFLATGFFFPVFSVLLWVCLLAHDCSMCPPLCGFIRCFCLMC